MLLIYFLGGRKGLPQVGKERLMKQFYEPGDILIFKAEDSFLSKSIAWLTDSDVSHGAMFYTRDSIVETIAPGVVVNQVRTGMGDPAYLLRLSPAKDPAPLLKAAKKYLDAGTQYNFPALLYLGGLLLCRKITPTAKLLSVAERIMDIACLELDKLLQKLAKHPENRSMVCSQFVYQVYEDCGEDYRIRIHSGSTNGFMSDERTIRLMDLRNQNFRTAPDSVGTYSDMENEETLIEELYQALSGAEADIFMDENILSGDLILKGVSNSIVPTVNKFAGKLEELMKILGSDAPVDSLFVAPADFVYHAQNLENKGEVQIERIR